MWNDCIDHGQVGQRGRYGVTRVAGIVTPLHRAVYCAEHGVTLSSIKGLVVRHVCDNPRCINPTHLELGTHKDNSADMVKRGRSCTGERNAACKLSDIEVQWIRDCYIPRHPTNGATALAASYGLSVAQISRIVCGLSR